MVSVVVATLLVVCDLSQSNRRQQPEQPERSVMSVSLGHFSLTVGSSSQPSSRSAPPLSWVKMSLRYGETTSGSVPG